MLLAVATISLIGCAKKNPEQIIGKWQNKAHSSTLEFFEDGTFSATFPYKIPSGEKVTGKMPLYDVMGKIYLEVSKSITYSREVTQNALIQKEDGTKEEIVGKYKPVEEDKRPSVIILIFLDKEGNIKIVKEHQGKKIEGYSTEIAGPLALNVNINGKEMQIDGALFKVDSMDLELNWCGTLSVKGLYRFRDESNFEAYIPLRVNTSNFSLIVFEGLIKEDQMSLKRANLGIKGREYIKMSN